MKVIIVGGVAGGASVATRLRRLDDRAKILMIERGAYVSYANCGLPYYIGGVITDKEDLSVLTPADMAARFHIDVRTRQEVIAVHPQRRTVVIRDLQAGREYEEVYDRLVLSPGASPVRPPIPGADHPAVFTLRTIPDTYAIRSYIEDKKPRHALVIGGGFIGLEMAENLLHAGLSVSVVEMLPQLMSSLDPEMAAILHRHLRKQGVDLRLETQVLALEEEGEGALRVRLSQGELSADLVILAVGVRPDTAFLKDSGIALSDRGLILTDEAMRTNYPEVFGLGDAAQVRHYVSGLPAHIPLAGPANRQARVVADQIAGLDSRYQGTQGSSIAQVLGLTVASTGLSEGRAKADGLDYDKVYTTAASHAGYYPGATPMTLKVLFERPSGRILGAQILGQDGVDKRCDVLAAAIHARQDAAFLGDLELCYAPPYNSARDPVNMLGYMIQDLRAGLVRQFHWHDVAGLLGRDDLTLLDVRPAADFARAHLPGALNIPMNELRDRMDELDREKPVYIYCRIGQTSYNAYRLLVQHGFEVQHLSGGYTLYRNTIEDQ